MSRVGQLLIASPNMPDQNFRRSVVIVLKDNDEGTMGFVLNRPTEDPLSKVWSELAEEQKQDAVIGDNGDEPLYNGGPVYGPLCAIHTHEKWGEEKVADGVYWSAEGDNLVQVIKAGGPFRFFLGYTGWAKGQLDHETECGGWVSFPAKKEYLFVKDPPGMYETDLWKRVLQDRGKEVWASLGVSPIPDDPRTN